MFFLEKVQTAFDPPPFPIFGNYIALFSRKFGNMRKFAMHFFGSEMTPPFPLFGHFFQNLGLNYTVLNTNKSAMKFFGSDFFQKTYKLVKTVTTYGQQII